MLTGRRARKDVLDKDTNNVEVAKASCPNWQGSRSAKDEERARNNEWRSKVENAIWQPCQNIQDWVSVRRQNVAEIGTVDDVFERGKNLGPDWRTP